MTVAEIFQTMEYGPAPESDAEARRWLASHREQQFGQFIDDPARGGDVDVVALQRQHVAAQVHAAVEVVFKGFENCVLRAGKLGSY